MPIKQSEVLQFARFNAVGGGSGVYNEISLATNLTIRAPYAWQIRALQLEIKASQNEWPAQNTTETLEVQFTRESKAAIIDYDDADLMEKVTRELQRVATVGTDAGPAYREITNPLTFIYTIPIYYTKPLIFIGLKSTFGSGTANVYGRIAYTITKITDKDFLNLLGAI
jgi:hypothetical protein